MSSNSSKPLKYYNGRKLIVINDVGWMNNLLSCGVFQARIAPLKIEKTKEKGGEKTGGIVLYQLSLFEVNTGVEKDVAITIPQQFSMSIAPAESTVPDVNEKVIIWDAETPEIMQFKAQINTFLGYWLEPIQRNNNFSSELPEIKYLGDKTLLKWPWKETSIMDYFNAFHNEQHLHQIRLGAAYYSLERNIVGVSLQLCSNAGSTPEYLNEVRETKKRKRNTEKSKTEKVVEEGENQT